MLKSDLKVKNLIGSLNFCSFYNTFGKLHLKTYVDIMGTLAKDIESFLLMLKSQMGNNNACMISLIFLNFKYTGNFSQMLLTLAREGP